MVACIILSDHPEGNRVLVERERERNSGVDLHCSNKPHLCVIWRETNQEKKTNEGHQERRSRAREKNQWTVQLVRDRKRGERETDRPFRKQRRTTAAIFRRLSFSLLWSGGKKWESPLVNITPPIELVVNVDGAVPLNVVSSFLIWIDATKF